MNFGRLTLHLRQVLLLMVALGFWLSGEPAYAQTKKAKPRNARFTWNAKKSRLTVSVSFIDVVDAKIRKKLNRGLPTNIVFTAALYRQGSKTPLSTTAQSCKITWLVWEELYLIEITRPGGSRRSASVTVDGVVRRCARANRLLVGTARQVPKGATVYLEAKVQVNPLSSSVLEKIKKWVSRPTGTSTAAPGDALFSTFTGLFLRRIGTAERELLFSTKASVPKVRRRRRR